MEPLGRLHRAASLIMQQEQAARFGHGCWDLLPCGLPGKEHFTPGMS